MSETIYVLTNYAFNHSPLKEPYFPLNPDFLSDKLNFVYYLIDQEIPDALRGRTVIREKEVDPTLALAGKKHLSEWAFLLAEEKHSFCSYPFFMVSSRFYEKNTWLQTTLSQEWPTLFSYLRQFRYGFLPSYDRPIRFLDINLDRAEKKQAWRYSYFPWKREAFGLINDLYGVRMPEDYRYIADLQCHYIGFQSRKELVAYVSFYRPLIEYFFDRDFSLIRKFDPYLRKTGSFRNERPLTLLLEILSHLYFFVEDRSCFAFHYDGYYSVDERETSFHKLEKRSIPPIVRAEQLLRWQWRRLKTEGFLSKWNAKREKSFDFA